MLANLQRGELDEAERELKLTTPRSEDEPWDMSMFDNRKVSRGDLRTRPRRRRRYRLALVARSRGRAAELAAPGAWRRAVQAGAVGAGASGAIASGGRLLRSMQPKLDLVAEITGALLRLAVGSEPLIQDRSLDIANRVHPRPFPVLGTLLLALAMTDLDRARSTPGTGTPRGPEPA